jgi:hypothetical protein
MICRAFADNAISYVSAGDVLSEPRESVEFFGLIIGEQDLLERHEMDAASALQRIQPSEKWAAKSTSELVADALAAQFSGDIPPRFLSAL